MSGELLLTGRLEGHKTTRAEWGVGHFKIEDVSNADGSPAPINTPPGFAPGCVVGVVGKQLGLACPGESLQLLGYVEDSDYGDQLRITQQASLGLRRPEDASRWLTRLDGVGPAKARALLDHFGDNLLKILRGEVEGDLADVHGISDRIATLVRDSFADLQVSADLDTLRYLNGLGLSRYEQDLVVKFAGARRIKARELLETTPFGLTKAKGLGFLRVDRIARAAGCPPTAPARIEAATLYHLGEHIQHGHTMQRLRSPRPGDGLIATTASALGLDGLLVYGAIRRLAKQGELVLTQDAKRSTWVHPAALHDAERVIFEAATGGGATKEAAPRIAGLDAANAKDEDQSIPAGADEPRVDVNTLLQLAAESDPMDGARDWV